MNTSRLVYGLLLLAASCAGAQLDDALQTLRTRAIVPAPETLDMRALEAVVHAVDPAGALGSSPLDTNCAVTVELLTGDLPYARITGVNPGCASCLTTAPAMSAATNAIGIILDFRGAGGSGFSDVAPIAAAFTGNPRACITVYDSRGKPRPGWAVEAGPVGPCPVAPVMVLADHRTRGAAEVLVAVLKRQPGVMLIGARTAGDWRVREAVPLPGGNEATVATGYVVLAGDPPSMPLGGIAPHIEVSDTQTDVPPMPARRFDGRAMSAEARADRELMLRVGGDAALLRATEILLGLQALNARRPPCEAATHVSGAVCTAAVSPDEAEHSSAAPADEMSPDPGDK